MKRAWGSPRIGLLSQRPLRPHEAQDMLKNPNNPKGRAKDCPRCASCWPGLVPSTHRFSTLPSSTPTPDGVWPLQNPLGETEPG